MNKKNIRKGIKNKKNNYSQRKNKLVLFTMYNKNKVNFKREKYFIGTKDNSLHNEEKLSLNKYKKLKPNKNNNIITHKNSFNLKPLSHIKKKSLEIVILRIIIIFRILFYNLKKRNNII